MVRHSGLCLFCVLLEEAWPLRALWSFISSTLDRGCALNGFLHNGHPTRGCVFPGSHQIYLSYADGCTIGDRGVLWLVGRLRRVRWQHSQRTGPSASKANLCTMGLCWLAYKKLSSAVLINADPQVNSLSRTAWLELLPGIWKQARDVISHQSRDIDRELTKIYLCLAVICQDTSS